MSAATTGGEGGKQQFPSVADGNGNASVIKYPSFKAPKPSFTNGSKHSSIDVFPLLVKEAAFPLKEDRCIDHSVVQDVCTISVLPDEGNTIPQSTTSHFTLLSFVKSLLPSKNQMLINHAQLNCQKTQNRINVLLGGTDSCVVDINVEKGNGAEAEEEEVVASLKSENHMQKVLQRQASLSTGKDNKYFDHKAISERCHDAPANRWRRYKRAASFDSRKIVILFSILSSVGTLILIYLTLRVRLINGDNSFNHM